MSMCLFIFNVASRVLEDSGQKLAKCFVAYIDILENDNRFISIWLQY